jgi:hypothetical protein
MTSQLTTLVAVARHADRDRQIASYRAPDEASLPGSMTFLRRRALLARIRRRVLGIAFRGAPVVS